MRRQASGTLAEVLGQSALPSDFQLRTLGLRRAAERTRAAIPATGLAWIEAYANGVNAYLQQAPLPPEYGALELSKATGEIPADAADEPTVRYLDLLEETFLERLEADLERREERSVRWLHRGRALRELGGEEGNEVSALPVSLENCGDLRHEIGIPRPRGPNVPLESAYLR